MRVRFKDWQDTPEGLKRYYRTGIPVLERSPCGDIIKLPNDVYYHMNWFDITQDLTIAEELDITFGKLNEYATNQVIQTIAPKFIINYDFGCSHELETKVLFTSTYQVCKKCGQKC